MITETKQNTIQRKGVKSEGKFQIKATGKAFRILSDGLYSDKIKAIMRELSCNAYDAHVEAGHLDKPFDVHIPNRLEPTFKIRDYGVGLSHDDVVNVYTTYFESTKTNSNDYIGCLGLGSKSPFSYVDNFSIVSYFNGEKRIYNAFLSEDETPTIALLTTGRTGEPNGLEVSFPVQVNDIHRFEEKANSVYTYFKLRPNFTGAKIEVEDVNYVLEGSNWGVRESRGTARAVMGNVAYNLSDFSGDLNDDESAISSLIHDVPIDVVFGIGDLEVAASRESLSYNKRTIANIKVVLKDVVDEIRKKASEKISNCDTLWEARVLAHEIKTGEFSHLKTILNGQDVFEWNGNSLSGVSYVKLSDDFKGEDFEVLCFHPKEKWRRRHRGNVPSLTISNDITHNIHTTKRSRVFVADINRGSHLRCRQVILESEDVGKPDYYGNCEKEVDRVYLVKGSKVMAEKFRKEVGLESIPAISTIVPNKSGKVYKQSEYNPKNSQKVLVYETDVDEHDCEKASTYWKKADVDVDAGGVYVVISRYKINGDLPANYISNIAEKMSLIGKDISGIKIVGVKESKASDFLANKKWKTLFDYTVDAFKEYIANTGLEDSIKMAAKLNKFNNYSSRIQSVVMQLDVDVTKPCGKFIEIVKALNAKVGDVSKLVSIRNACGCLRIELNEKESDIDLEKEWDKVDEAYPLLEKLDVWGISDRKGEVKEYIDALDLMKF